MGMNIQPGRKHIIIAPQIYVSMEPAEARNFNQETQLRRAEIPMVWIQDGDNFRLDINLPDSGVLDMIFSSPLSSLHINGETIWENNTAHAVQVKGAHVESTPAGLRLTCTSSGSIHILARGVMGSSTPAS